MNLTKIINEIKEEKGVEAIYLFGSQATGKTTPLSDIDICVVTSKHANKESILANSSDKIDTNIFWDLPLNIRFRVIKDGKLLYKKNKLNIHRLIVSTVLSYLDFKPLLDRHFERFLK